MDSPDADLDLVRRTQAGDRHAFDMLVVRHQRRVAHVLSRYIRSPQEIEDLTQETFIKAYRGIASFRGDSAFATWLHRIAVNTAKNLYAMQRSRIQFADPSPSQDEDGEARTPEPATDEDPERLLQSKQIGAAIAGALQTLPEVERRAIELRELEGKSYDEIALLMDCPIGTVRSRIFRAREGVAAALRPLLGPTRNRRW